MSRSVALFCLAVGFGVAGSESASAASPAYCALYAREYAAARIGGNSSDEAATALRRIEDQAYYRCLNLDDEPEFPITSAYFGTEDTDSAIGGPFEEIAEGDAAINDETDATNPAPLDTPVVVKPVAKAKPVAPKPKPTQTASDNSGGGKPRGSGLTAWSPEWVTWCSSHYKSFNATTGMVTTLSGTHIICP